MAKLNHFIAEYSEAISSTGIDIPKDSKLPKVFIRKFLKLTKKNLTDDRVKGMITYPLEEIVLIAFLAVLGGAASWTEIESFGESKLSWLRKFIKLENGIPSHDTFRRVFGLIHRNELQAMTVEFLLSHVEGIRRALNVQSSSDQYRQICVDGKEQRHSGRNYNDSALKVRNLQTLHVYDTATGICLYSQPIEEKTNEIPTAQGILSAMDLKNTVVSFDAMNTQKETAAVIRRQGGHYVGGLKGNQSALKDFAEVLFADEKAREECKTSGLYFSTTEKAHDHIETREYFVYKLKDASKYDETKGWAGLKTITLVKKTIKPLKGDNKTDSVEERYYISSLDSDAELLADAIRGHWSVEQFHWHLDTVFEEDDNTTMDPTAFNNKSLLNKMALSLMKLARPLFKKGTSIRVIQKNFGWNYEENLAKLLASLDEDTLRAALESAKV